MKKTITLLICLFAQLPIRAQPAFNWAKQLGGGGGDFGNAIAVDQSGNVYTTGYFDSIADFDPGTGTNYFTSAGDNDIFISKLDVAGKFAWAKQMGDTGNDVGYAISTDQNGNVYAAGYFQGIADFDPGAGTVNLTSAGGFDIFIIKLDTAGNFVWAKNIGGAGDEYGNSIAVDNNGNVHTTGYFQGIADFDPAAVAYNLTSAGGNDIFVSKLDSAGSFVWAKQMGGTSNDISYAVAVDGNGNVHTTGFFFSSPGDFDPGTATFNLSPVASADIFVSKLDSSGNFVWAKNMGGTNNEIGYEIAVDPAGSGDVYTTGYFIATANFNPAGVYNLSSYGMFDAFVSKLDSAGNFVWAKQLGGSASEAGYSIVTDGSYVYISGGFEGTADFDPGTGVYNLTPAGDADAFVCKLDSAGGFVCAGRMGGAGDGAIGYDIAFDSIGNIYSTGFFSAMSDFDPGTGTFNLTPGGTADVFVSRLGSCLQTGISENHFPEMPFSIYPNPSNGTFYFSADKIIQHGNIKATLYNTSGKIIFEKEMNWNDGITISDAVNGIYFLRITSNNYTVMKKVLIAK